MTHHVVGLDLSMTNTGVAVIRGGEAVRVRNVLSGPPEGPVVDGRRQISLLARRNRLQSIAARVLTFALEGHDPEVDDAPLFVIEAPVYAGMSASGSVHDRAGLWWLITHLAFKRGIVVEVSPTALKRYATGKGSGRKEGVLAALPHMVPGLFIDDDNAADAVVLAAMGARALGHPVEPSPQRVTPAALDSVSWPSGTARRSRT